MALQTAILVAFTQIIPEHQVQVFGFIKTRVKVSYNVLLNLGTSIEAIIDSSYGISYSFHRALLRRISMSLDHHSVWLVRWLDIPPILQKERQ